MRTPTLPLTPAALERWESWPLWAIGLSNGLNIALWFVLSMVRVKAAELNITAPTLLNTVLPWLIVAGAVAAALSLDGVLIAAIAGARHGRVGCGPGPRLSARACSVPRLPTPCTPAGSTTRRCCILPRHWCWCSTICTSRSPEKTLQARPALRRRCLAGSQLASRRSPPWSRLGSLARHSRRWSLNRLTTPAWSRSGKGSCGASTAATKSRFRWLARMVVISSRMAAASLSVWRDLPNPTG